MKRQERFSAPIVGGSMLLVIFAVLCLTVLALMSLSTVQSQKRLADGAVNAVVSYYEADCQAQEIYARLRNGEKVEGVQQKDDQYTYVCTVSESQKLMVVLQCREEKWKVWRWQVQVQEQDVKEDGPRVWDGE